MIFHRLLLVMFVSGLGKFNFVVIGHPLWQSIVKLYCNSFPKQRACKQRAKHEVINYEFQLLTPRVGQV